MINGKCYRINFRLVVQVSLARLISFYLLTVYKVAFNQVKVSKLLIETLLELFFEGSIKYDIISRENLRFMIIPKQERNVS